MPLEGTTQPQLYLKRLHQADIPALFIPKTPPRTRQNLVQAAKAELAAIDEALSAEMAAIRAKYGKRRKKKDTSDQLERILAPYEPIYEVLKRVQADVANLEETMLNGRMLPQFKEFPEVLFGDAETGEWYLGDPDAARVWDEIVTLRNRIAGLISQRDPLVTQIEAKKAQVAEAKAAYEKIQGRYERRRSRGAILTRLAFWFLLVLSAGGGAAVFLLRGEQAPLVDAQADPLLGGGLIVLALVLLLAAIPLQYVSWRGGLRKLEAKVAESRETLSNRRKEGKELQSRYMPVADMLRTSKAEYDDLRDLLSTLLEPQHGNPTPA